MKPNPNQSQLDFDRARTLRDQGMAASTAHADAVSPTWSDRALAFVHEWAVSHQTFTSEDVRIFAHNMGLPTPPDQRAWGTVMLAAARKGWTRKAGYVTARDPKVHMQEIRLWESLLWMTKP